MKTLAGRVYRAGAILCAAATVAACSGALQKTAPFMPQRSASHVHAMWWGLGTTQPTVSGSMVVPLTLSISGSAGTFSVYGGSLCAAASNGNPCPNVNYTAAPPTWANPSDASLTFAGTTLNVTCPTMCYVVAYEGGAGPYLIQGPGAANSPGTVTLGNEFQARYFLANTSYSFFLEHVTSINTPPPPPPPSPTPVPTAAPTPTMAPTATPCASSSGDDDAPACVTPAPKPTCGEEDGRHHRRHDARRHGTRRRDDCDES